MLGIVLFFVIELKFLSMTTLLDGIFSPIDIPEIPPKIVPPQESIDISNKVVEDNKTDSNKEAIIVCIIAGVVLIYM